MLGAAEANVILTKRDSSTAEISVEGQPVESVKILAINEFDSKRRCMSVVVRVASPTAVDSTAEDESSEIVWGPPILYCKGADSSMFTNCVNSYYLDTCKIHVNDFACSGLRTLVMAQRELSEDEFSSWIERYKVASKSLSNRKEMLKRCAEDIGELIVLTVCKRSLLRVIFDELRN